MAAEYWSTDAAASDSYVLAVQAGWFFSGGLPEDVVAIFEAAQDCKF